MNDFFGTVRQFILDYLPNQRCLAENTIWSYSHTLNLFVSYSLEAKKIRARKFNFSCLDKTLLLDYLGWLETVRGCSASTRNQHLMALRSFLKYAGHSDCTQMALYLSACDIPIKKGQAKTVQFLSEPSLAALLQQPDVSKQKGLQQSHVYDPHV